MECDEPLTRPATRSHSRPPPRPQVDSDAFGGLVLNLKIIIGSTR